MKIDTGTKVFGIFGNPVTHSKSPAIHNAWFKQYGINAVYLAFEIRDIEKGIAAIRALNIKGLSITIPFKESVVPYLDDVDELAQKIGAVNTIVNKGGVLKGYNTDCNAAVAPLKQNLDITGKTVCILGAGGAAKAVAFGIQKEKADIIIVNRDEKKGSDLGEKINGRAIGLKEIDRIKNHHVDILINTTCVGMIPNVDAQPFPTQYLKSHMTVMDVIYTPVTTRLLSRAQNKGCKTIDGLSMFIHQGAAQFELWTGICPDIEKIYANERGALKE